ncbi:MAG TPA: CBS domain-containing protein [Alphaproteobacteria bacterium]|nr:CBS domain-containing protein [Alphaproteobacteria bacterium]
MTQEIMAAAEDTPLNEIATTLEEYRIKRIPVVWGGKSSWRRSSRHRAASASRTRRLSG